MRLGELQRVERIDQAGAETVVALAERKPLGARREDAANVHRRELRIALEQQRHDAAHRGGRCQACRGRL